MHRLPRPGGIGTDTVAGFSVENLHAQFHPACRWVQLSLLFTDSLQAIL